MQIDQKLANDVNVREPHVAQPAVMERIYEPVQRGLLWSQMAGRPLWINTQIMQTNAIIKLQLTILENATMLLSLSKNGLNNPPDFLLLAPSRLL